MIKPELVRNIVNNFKVDEKEAAYFVDNIFMAMSDALSKGKNINIPEFGKFRIVFRMIDGTRKRCVTFSPVKKFAESVNDSYNNLEPQITRVFSLKNSDILTVKELMPDENDVEYLCFIFEEKSDVYIPDDIIQEKSASPDSSKSISVKEDDSIVDNEKVFEIPASEQKLIHDLKDEFSGEDIDKDISFLLLNREAIIDELKHVDAPKSKAEETITPVFTETSEEDIVIQTKPKRNYEDDIILPPDSGLDKLSADAKDTVVIHADADSSMIEQPDNKVVQEADNVELRTFQKLLEDDNRRKAEILETEETAILTEDATYEQRQIKPDTEVISHNEPKTLNEALENFVSESSSEPTVTQDSKKPETFNEIFVTKESRSGPRPNLNREKTKKISGFLKVSIYLIFVVMFGIMCYYLFNLIFKKTGNNEILEEIRKPSTETMNKQFATDEKVKGESIQVENFNGAIYRKLGNYFYIEYNMFNSINEASDKEAKLKSNMISCRVEAVMTVENAIEYRVLIGPFEALDEAKEYYKEYKSILDSVK